MRSLEDILRHSGEGNTDNKWNNIEGKDYMEKLPKPVYYIESPNDDTVLVGMDVTIDYEKFNNQDVSKITWYDTIYERIMLASETRQKGDYFAFKRIDEEGGGYYYFTPMNLDIYNDKVKKHLLAGSDFANNEDLIKAFLATKEDEV